MLAARQAAAWDTYLASPEFAQQQAGQQALIAELMLQADAAMQLFAADHALVQPRRQGDVDLRGSQGGISE